MLHLGVYIATSLIFNLNLAAIHMLSRCKILTILSPLTPPSSPPRLLQKLYSFAGDFRAYKALIAAQYNGVKLVSF